MSNDSYEIGLRVWERWTEMWNGSPEIALEMAASPFVLHLPSADETDDKTVSSPRAVMEWVARSRAKYTRITFSTEAGPFVDVKAGIVAGPWIAEVVVDGQTRYARGMDTIAYGGDGKITEYWTISKPSAEAGTWAQRGAAK